MVPLKKIIKILHSSWCRMHPYGGKIDHQMGGKPPPAGPIFPPYGGKIGLPGGQFLCCTHNECKISPYYHHGKPWLQNDLVVFPPLWGEKTTYAQRMIYVPSCFRLLWNTQVNFSGLVAQTVTLFLQKIIQNGHDL